MKPKENLELDGSMDLVRSNNINPQIPFSKVKSSKSYLFRHGKKSVPYGHKWRISAPEIEINNPKIIDLFSCKFYDSPHKGRFGIVYYNPRHTCAKTEHF